MERELARIERKTTKMKFLIIYRVGRRFQVEVSTFDNNPILGGPKDPVEQLEKDLNIISDDRDTVIQQVLQITED